MNKIAATDTSGKRVMVKQVSSEGSPSSWSNFIIMLRKSWCFPWSIPRNGESQSWKAMVKQIAKRAATLNTKVPGSLQGILRLPRKDISKPTKSKSVFLLQLRNWGQNKWWWDHCKLQCLPGSHTICYSQWNICQFLQWPLYYSFSELRRKLWIRCGM